MTQPQDAIELLGTAPKRQRTKVRTGCATCKQRRVKCDEGKPRCQRCTRSELECYYKIIRPKVMVAVPTSTGGTKMAELGSVSASLQTAETAALQAPVIQPSNLTFGSEEENLAIQTFARRIGPNTSLYYIDKDFWTQLLIQASWNDSAVKHSLVAVTMVDMKMTSGILSTNYSNRALHHYNAAIRQLTRGQPPIASVLIVCILAWFHDTLSNNAEHSLVHLSAADNIVEENMRSRSEAGATYESDLVQMMKRVQLTAAECKGHTVRILEQQVKEQQAATPASDVGEWVPGRHFTSLDEAVNVLESYLHGLNKSSSSTGQVDKHELSKTITQLGRWLIAFSSYRVSGSETKAASKIVQRTYTTLFDLIQVLISHHLEAEAGNQTCCCADRLAYVSKQVWELMVDGMKIMPETKNCLIEMLSLCNGTLRS